MYRLSLFGGNANNGLKVGRYWNLNNDSGNSNWNIGGSHYYRSVYTLRALKLETGTHKHIIQIYAYCIDKSLPIGKNSTLREWLSNSLKSR